MQYRKLSETGDYTFGLPLGSGFYAGTSAVAQSVYTTLKLLQSEWWEDTSQGVPLFQSIVGLSGTPASLHAADLLIQSAILGVPGVQGINSFASSFAGQTRTYTVTQCNVQTQYGDIGLEEVSFR